MYLKFRYLALYPIVLILNCFSKEAVDTLKSKNVGPSQEYENKDIGYIHKNKDVERIDQDHRNRNSKILVDKGREKKNIGSTEDYEEHSSERHRLDAYALHNILNRVLIVNSENGFKRLMHSGTLQLLVFYTTEFLGNLSDEQKETYLNFLYNFDDAFDELKENNIYVGIVNCSSNSKPSSCSEDKIGNFAYGFQNEVEKIAFPLDTMYSLDSIVASALHLSLLHNVPIIQSLSERRALEARCRNKCDIILSYHQSLGTKDHRLFLESSIAFKDDSNLVFALTTYLSGIYGLPESPLREKDYYYREPSIYIIHCSNQSKSFSTSTERSLREEYVNQSETLNSYEEKKKFEDFGKFEPDSSKSRNCDNDPCSFVSHFHCDFNKVELHTFLSALRLPIWYEISEESFIVEDLKSRTIKCSSDYHHNCKAGENIDMMKPMIDPQAYFIGSFSIPHLENSLCRRIIEENYIICIRTPFSNLHIPWAVIVYDDDTTPRIESIVSPLAKLLQGSVAIVIINRFVFTANIEKYFAVNLEDLKMPAILFFDPFGECKITPFVNEFSEAYEWIVDQFYIYSQSKKRKQKKLLCQPENIDQEQELSNGFIGQDDLRQDDEAVKVMVHGKLNTETTPAEIKKQIEDSMMKTRQRFAVVVAFILPWDPVSNILIQHLRASVQPLRKYGSLAKLNHLNCYDWPEFCAEFQVMSSFPVLKFIVNGKVLMTYNRTVDAQHIIRSILLVECIEIFPSILQTEKELMNFLNHGISCVASKLEKSYIVGIFSISKGAKNFSRMSQQFYGYKLVALHVSDLAVKERCINKSGCIIISKPADIHQTEMQFAWKDEELETMVLLIQHHSESTFAPLDPERLLLASPPSTRKKKEVSFILIIIGQGRHVSYSEQQTTQQLQPLEKGKYFMLKECFLQTIGTLAAIYTRPGIVFSYLEDSEELQSVLLEVYKLQPGYFTFVALDREVGHVTVYEPYFRMMCPPKDDLSQWIEDVISGINTPTVFLPSGNWSPVMEGFDYLNYMENDFLREAEKQFSTDMEEDIGEETSKKL